jgi:hypothetical protein
MQSAIRNQRFLVTLRIGCIIAADYCWPSPTGKSCISLYFAADLTRGNDIEDGRWQEIERLYNGALERKPEERAPYLEKACGNESPRKEVESLLACQPEAKGFIESPALEAAAQDLAGRQSKAASLALAGRTLSHFRIIEKLGEGGHGRRLQSLLHSSESHSCLESSAAGQGFRSGAKAEVGWLSRRDEVN